MEVSTEPAPVNCHLLAHLLLFLFSSPQLDGKSGVPVINGISIISVPGILTAGMTKTPSFSLILP